MIKRKLLSFYIVIALLVLALDRLSKGWALVHCQESYALFPGITCELFFNEGVSWGLFPARTPVSRFLLWTVLIAIIGGLCYHLSYAWKYQKTILGEILVLVGALSNIIDRYLCGAVIDFIHVSYGAWEFPTYFNIADMAIVLGIVIMLLFLREPNA